MALLFAINLIATAATEIEISWLWFAVGILAWAAIVGPIGASRLGRSVSEWFRRIGGAGRLIGIAVVIGVFWIAVPALDFSPVPFYSFGFGGMFVITVLILVRYLASIHRGTALV